MARAKALKMASILWWLLRPYMVLTWTLALAPRAKPSKKSRKHPVSLSTAAGPLKVPAGHTWIELVPIDKDGGKITFQK